MIAVVILSAGESRRMGQPKALLPFPEHFSAAHSQPATTAKTFLQHLIEVTRYPRAPILRLVVGAHAAEIRARVELPDDAVVVNHEWEKGQLSSLQAAIRSLPAGETTGMLVCLVDHPLISARLVQILLETFERHKNKIVIPTYQGRRGHPVIFPAALYPELLAAPENVGARAVVRAHGADVIEVPVNEEGVVMNLNDPATLERVTKK
ncbi:MAG: nucleotidyltransferase family protein [Candidatus Acidiferrales bacterium]